MTEGEFRFDRELIESQTYTLDYSESSPLVVVTPELETALSIVIDSCARALTRHELWKPHFYGVAESDLRAAIEMIATTPRLGYAIDARIQELPTHTYRVVPKYDTYYDSDTQHLGGFWRELSGIRVRSGMRAHHDPFIFWTNDLHNLLDC